MNRVPRKPHGKSRGGVRTDRLANGAIYETTETHQHGDERMPQRYEFEGAEVRALVEEAQAAPVRLLTEAQRYVAAGVDLHAADAALDEDVDHRETGAPPGLWLTNDSGVYLRSNAKSRPKDSERTRAATAAACRWETRSTWSSSTPARWARCAPATPWSSRWTSGRCGCRCCGTNRDPGDKEKAAQVWTTVCCTDIIVAPLFRRLTEHQQEDVKWAS